MVDDEPVGRAEALGPEPPSSSQSWASTSTAARKPITGPSRPASARAARGEIAPVPMTRAAVGTAATTSGQPRGRISAHASTASRAATETASAAAFGTLSSRAGKPLAG
jgi:hypothetical protein